MAEKIVSSIKEQESKAKEIIEDQKKQNLTDLENALAASKERVQNVNAAKQKKVLEAVKKADTDAEGKISEIKKEYDEKIAKLNEIAKGNLDESVRFIISNI